jgi:phosphorylase kinase alpha/beta subunit
LDSITLKFLS